MSGTTTDPTLHDALHTWCARVAQAGVDGHGLHLRGGGSKAFLGQPVADEVPLLDTREHRGVVSYEPTELVLTARCGTPLAEVEQLLASHGQTLAFEPPHLGAQATLGGAVASGLSGPARASAGALRDHVLGMQIINGQAEVLNLGGQVMKNVAGYDLSRLMAGSLGTLGLITQVSLKVLPVAAADATLRFALSQAEALQALARWRARPLPLNASCWWAEPGTPTRNEWLDLRLRGAAAAVQAASEALCAEFGGRVLAPEHASADWEARREQCQPFFTMPPAPGLALWRLSVPQLTPPLAHAGDTLIEWHGAQRWLWAPPDDGTRLHGLARAAGGHASRYRAPKGVDPAQGRAALEPASAAIHRRLKAAFDPHGVFNPGRWPELA